jgi:hypothetical protein
MRSTQFQEAAGYVTRLSGGVGGRRWASIDVMHSCLIDQRHVRLAAAIKGVRRGGGQESMTVTITIDAVAG